MGVALIALFVAMGGSAYALSQKAVRSAHIDTRAVTTRTLDNRAVSPRKLRVDAIRTRHLEDGAVNSARVRDGSLIGDDIDQSTLDDVDAAALGGSAPGAFGAGMMTARINDIPGGGQNYGSPSGTSSALPEREVTMLSPDFAVRVRDLRVKLTEPANLNDRDFRFRIDGENAGTGLLCTVSPGDDQCTAPGTDVIPAGSEISIGADSVGLNPTADAMIGWRATMP